MANNKEPVPTFAEIKQILKESALARKKSEEESALARKKHEEESALARKKHEEESALARKKHEEESALARKKREEESALARKKHEEESALARKKHEKESALARKKHEEEMREFRKKHEAKMAKWDEKRKKIEAEIRELEKKEKKDVQELRDNLNKTEQLLNKTIGDAGNNWGDLSEQLVKGNLAKHLNQWNIKVDEVIQNLKSPSSEVDIVAVNGKEVVVVEVKLTLKPSDVKKFSHTIKQFTTLWPHFKGKKVYGALAFLMKAHKRADDLAKNQGFFVIEATGDVMIKNKASFKPQTFS